MNRANFFTRIDVCHLFGTAALLSCLAPGLSMAGSFAISEASSRASGRGTAAAALHDDAAAVFYNPANVSRAEGLRINLGASGLLPRWQYSPADTPGGPVEKSEAGLVTPPNFSATWMLGNAGFGDIGAGLGVYVPYGSTFAWPGDWSGREQIQRIGFTVLEVSPVLAIRPHRLFALGAGFRYLPARVYLKRGVRFGDQQEGAVELAGDGSGMGANAGLSFWPLDRLALAVSWRSQVTLKLTGVSDFQFPAPFDASAVDRDVRTEVPLAEVFRFGVAYDVLRERLNVSADVEYQRWSVYKELRITFVNPDGTEQISASPRNSKDSFVLHLGAEYKLSPRFAVRAGYVFDQHTLPEETVNPMPPDSDRHIAALGASFTPGRFGLHAHFSNVFFTPRTSLTSSFPGQWQGAWAANTTAYTFGLTASYQLDVRAPLGDSTFR
jgi:long-chain fatty acid transport protein